MPRRRGLAIAAVTLTFALVSGGVAHAYVFGTAASPMTLKIDGVTLGQARGSMDLATASSFTTSSVYVKDPIANGNGVFFKVDTNYYARWYNDNLAGPYFGWFTSERVRTGAYSTNAWSYYANQTKTVVADDYLQDLLGNYGFTIYMRVCEDRGILRADPCYSVKQSYVWS